MYRFFEDINSLDEKKIILSKENAHHMISVLRMDEKENFEVVIDKKVYLCNLSSLDKQNATALIKDSYDDKNESNLKINLYQGLPKSDKLDLIVQKAVELGVSKIIPFESSRTVVKWDSKKEEKKIKRLEEIAHAAAKQAKRSVVPEIKKSISFKNLVNEMENGLSVIAYENRGKTLKEVLTEYKRDEENKEVNIVIGPEGGFSEEEVRAIEEKGAFSVHLGNRILRTETAAIALMAMIQYEIGDINEKI